MLKRNEKHGNNLQKAQISISKILKMILPVEEVRLCWTERTAKLCLEEPGDFVLDQG